MSAHPISPLNHPDGESDWELLDYNLLNHLTLSEALKDSPAFRQVLARSEIIASRVHAHYNLAMEGFRHAIQTGGAFASALASLARCIEVESLPKQTCSTSCIPNRWSGVNYDVSKTLKQISGLLLRFARDTSNLVAKFAEPENLLSQSSSQLNEMFDLRITFHRTSEQLNTALSRASTGHGSRSQNDLTSTDGQVVELRNFYKSTASAYLTSLRRAISSTPMTTYLCVNKSLLLAERSYAEQLNSYEQSHLDTPSASSLTAFLTKLSTWAETSRRVDHMQLEAPNDKVSRADETDIEGYLLKRSSKRTWRSWDRRWFRINCNRLIYCKRVPSLSLIELQSVTDLCQMQLKKKFKIPLSQVNDTSNGTTGDGQTEFYGDFRLLYKKLLSQSHPCWKVMEADLRFCTARESSANSDRRFVFEIVAPENRIHHLQAESAASKEQWVEALRSGMLHLQRSNNSSNILLDTNNMAVDRLTHRLGQDLSSCSNESSVSSWNTSDKCSVQSNILVESRSQQSIPDYDRLRSQGGILLWNEPDQAGNRLCADCSVDGTSWASINLGVTLCTHCAAAHRSLGVHVSKIRSLTLDNWEPELLHLMLNLGNNIVNQIYEANLSQHQIRIRRPTGKSSSEQRRVWAKAKWAQCHFVRQPLGSGGGDESGFDSGWIYQLYDSWLARRKRLERTGLRVNSRGDAIPSREPSEQMRNFTEQKHRGHTILGDLCKTLSQLCTQYKSARKHNQRGTNMMQNDEQLKAAAYLLDTGSRLGCVPLMLAGIASGAHPDGDAYSTHRTQHGPNYTPLIWAVRSGSLAACEFLLLNGADIDLPDDQGRTALHHACELQRVHVVCLLLRRRADQTRTDRKGRKPLDIAVGLASADIVTLLRLQRLHDDTKESDYNLTDETVTDVFRDFTSRAYFFDSGSEESDYTLADLHHSNSTPSLVPETTRSSQPIPQITSEKSITSESVTFISPIQIRVKSPSRTSPTLASDRRRRVISPAGGSVQNNRSPPVLVPKPTLVVTVKPKVTE
ncbi:unnamed protein product [Calicophoron daubneyi]|uniref:Arf-GAP with coiled-coil, ANK repeat and PH domain-containing protein 2 n=1 Tax=Calicophoron daubneyi TaxID=300641 RepID=A0AAV2THA3_CALDB